MILRTMQDYADLIRTVSKRGVLDCDAANPQVIRIQVSWYHVEWIRMKVEEGKLISDKVVVEPLSFWDWLTLHTVVIRDHM